MVDLTTEELMATNAALVIYKSDLERADMVGAPDEERVERDILLSRAISAQLKVSAELRGTVGQQEPA